MLRICALSCFALLCRGQDSYTIAGHVVRHLDQRPVKGVQVSLAMVKDQAREVSVISGEDGEFTFQGVPAAKYQLRVMEHGAVQLYQQTENFSTAIVTGPNLDTEHISFLLNSPASIAGSVVDEYNEPVPRVQIYLFQQTLVGGKQGVQNHGQANTDTGGKFHFRGLEPGTYYVAAVGRPWYAQMGNPAEAHSELDVTYPVTYYGGATSAEGATPLRLEEGQKAEVQIGLHAVPALHIKMDELPRRGARRLMLEQTGPGGTVIHLPVGMMKFDGHEELTGVAPGTYKLTREASSQTISFTGDSELAAAPAAETTIKGKVILEGSKPSARVMLAFRDEVSSRGQSAPVQPDGSFEMSGVAAGHYLLELAGMPDSYLAKVNVKGARYANGVLEAQAGSQIELEITPGHGLQKVEGMATRDQKPMAGAMVLLVPKERNLGRPMARDQSDSDGTFTMAGVAPGRYTLLAIDDGRGLAYADAAVIAPYLERGQVVDVPLVQHAVVEVQHRLQ